MELSALVHALEEALLGMLGSAATSSGRQNPMADYLWERLRQRLPAHLWPHLRKEAKVPGLAREKSWDLGLVYPIALEVHKPSHLVLTKKPRLLLSLKSILANPSGSWPNRLDDLVGEASSVQMLFPEVVIGYVVVIDYGAHTKKKDTKRKPQANELAPIYAHFKDGLAALSRREPPLWSQGLIEGHWVVEIDTRREPILQDPLETVQRGEDFLDALVDSLRKREPLLFLDKGQ